MFTGHWPRDIGARWLTPLRGNLPTLAEYLGAHGYATAGFISNVVYCSQESGLARGFTHYEDYEMERLAPLRTSILVEKITTFIFEAISAFDVVPLYPVRDFVGRMFVINPRKDAASIRRGLLNWLAHRREPDLFRRTSTSSRR
jgi:hypothetical protein